MSVVVIELYQALRAAGVTEDMAQAAARAVIASEQAVTRGDFAEFRAEITTAIAKLETRMVRTLITTMVAMTGIFAVFVAAMAWVNP